MDQLPVFIVTSAEVDQHDAVLKLVASSLAVPVDAPVTVAARLLDSDGQAVPITETFLVPVFNDAGVVAAIKGVSFVDGVAETVLTFKSSGYYRITEAGINSRLTGLRISLPQPFELTVYEA